MRRLSPPARRTATVTGSGWVKTLSLASLDRIILFGR